MTGKERRRSVEEDRPAREMPRHEETRKGKAENGNAKHRTETRPTADQQPRQKNKEDEEP